MTSAVAGTGRPDLDMDENTAIPGHLHPSRIAHIRLAA